jgi:hypothetical protein
MKKFLIRQKKSISLCVEAHKWNILNLTLNEAHLDLMINLPASISVDSAIKILKSENKIIPWDLGYLVETVGDLDLYNCELCLKNEAKNSKKQK